MVTPMVETTWSKVTPVVKTVKSQVEEKVMPVIPTKVSETVQSVHNSAVNNLSAAVEKVALKAVDASLEMVEGVLNIIGSDENGTIRTSFRKMHTTANNIRITAVKKAGTEKAKKIEEANIFGAVFEVFGLGDLLEFLGFGMIKTDSVNEDEYAKVVFLKRQKDDPEPVTVDTECSICTE